MRITWCIITLCFLSISCENITDNSPEGNDNILSKVNVGPDQESSVGSYVVFDISESSFEGKIKESNWIQGTKNPQQVIILAPSSINEKTKTYFQKEGLYSLVLMIRTNKGETFYDSVNVTVKPRQPGLIEDIYLEARIRYRLADKAGELNSMQLQRLDSLQSASFSPGNHKVESLKGLEHCNNLLYLQLPLQSIKDVTPLANLHNLEYLSLNQNYIIEDISPLSNLTNLTFLSLYTNRIKDISALSNMTKLSELWLMDNPIYDISALSNLTNLEFLYASGVGIGCPAFKSLEPMSHLTKLQKLDIAGRSITDISMLESLTNLILLNVGFNDITNIAAISKMSKLIRLYINTSKVNDLSGIRYCQNLEYLDAMDAKIKDISELEYLPKLGLIGLSRNQIEDLLPLVKNPYLGKETVIFLAGNPLSKTSREVYIPQLLARGVTIVL